MKHGELQGSAQPYQNCQKPQCLKCGVLLVCLASSPTGRDWGAGSSGCQEVLVDLPVPNPLCCPSVASRGVPAVRALVPDCDSLFFN